jgi:hypothetical protein
MTLIVILLQKFTFTKGHTPLINLYCNSDGVAQMVALLGLVCIQISRLAADVCCTKNTQN